MKKNVEIEFKKMKKRSFMQATTKLYFALANSNLQKIKKKFKWNSNVIDLEKNFKIKKINENKNKYIFKKHKIIHLNKRRLFLNYEGVISQLLSNVKN